MMDRAGHRRAVHEALALAEAIGNTELAAEALAMMAVLRMGAGDADGACESLRAARARAPHHFAGTIANGGHVLYLRGHLDEALEHCRTYEAPMRRAGDQVNQVAFMSSYAMVLAARGRHGEAWQMLQEARAVTDRHRLAFGARVAVCAAGILADLGDLDGAATGAEEARQLARERGFVPSQISAAIDLGFIAVRRGNALQARGHLEEATAHMAAVKGPHEFIFGERLAVARAEVALAAGDAAQALSLADLAIEQTAKRPKYRGLALQARALALSRLGRTGEALVAQRQAVEIARRLDDPALMLRLLTTLLSLDRSEALAAEAHAVAARIDSALPDGPLRDRFRASRRATT
jgi:tetratricopeptide (TPR) repeat protein